MFVIRRENTSYGISRLSDFRCQSIVLSTLLDRYQYNYIPMYDPSEIKNRCIKFNSFFFFLNKNELSWATRMQMA